MNVSPPPSSPPITQPLDVIHANEVDDPSGRTDSSEEEVDEGLVPDSDSSDTDVDGDFELDTSTALVQPIPSPGIIGAHDPPPAAEMIREEPSVKIGLIQERIASSLGFHISYRKAWKSKQKAIVRVFGDWAESYAFLPRWLDYMLLFSPGSAYKPNVNEHRIDGRLDGSHKVFKRVFWTFKQCCDAFNYCKPMLQIDGTHLYGKYRGTLMIATAVDSNNYVLPVAFAVVSCENIDNWSWFLAMLRIHVTQKDGICLISDRHAGILAAVNNVALGWQPPKAYHVFCVIHLASNFNHKFKNIMLKKQLKKLGYTTSRLDFDAGLEKFKESSPQIAAWIDRIPKEKWSISYDAEGRRFGHMTTNLSECVNKVLKGARNLPITSLVRITYARLNEYFLAHGQEAREEMDKGNRFAKVFWVEYVKNQQNAATHFVTSYDRQKTRFEVQESYNQRTHRGGKKWWVSLQDRACQCGEFTAFRYPCSHVIAACKSVNHDPLQYIDPAYSASYQCQVYSGQWYPIGNEDFIPPSQGPTILPDVSLRRKKGRPRSTRIRNEMDQREGVSQQVRCGYCRVVGHDRRRCPSRLQGN
ncbi:uncharacterized protein LOC133301815 [Gastrolobium bilobum]|uniref:uncharacterized protein LOC133301815 n=1 Tax=Gastrolobium bilobum TaxID=150636 RepID=UPI002AB138ED|nr:uncharacterized protein LOC133301815 [Gastrolobium bilobum]